MNLTLSLLQQILSLPQEETLVPLDRFFASRDERELQLLGFLPPDEEEKNPRLAALTFDSLDYQEDWEAETRPRRSRPQTYRQMLTQKQQGPCHRPSLLDSLSKISLGKREIEVVGGSGNSIGEEETLLIARFLNAGVKAGQMGGEFSPSLSALFKPRHSLAGAAAAGQRGLPNPREPVRLIPGKKSERVAARKRMTLSVGMKERAYTCTLEGREHHFWIEQVQLYDLWSDQEERIRDWKESGKCRRRNCGSSNGRGNEPLQNSVLKVNACR